MEMKSIGSRKWWALGAITLGVLAVGLDLTVLSVALPILAKALHATESDLQWFSSAYALVLAACMLPAGVLGDRFGRKFAMLISLVLFAGGSIGCAFATDPAAFIAARIALGAAGAGLVVMALSVVAVLFTEEERPRAVGIWGAANFLALPIGPILGGWLLTNYWWGWIFLLNVPVALLAFVAVMVLVPESRAPERPALDPIGMLAVSIGLATVTYGLIELGRNGWTDPRSLATLASGVALVVVFFLWEQRMTLGPGRPALVDLSLFSSPAFTWGVILVSIGVFAMFGLMFTLPQYTQGVKGVDAQGAGFRLLPLILGIVLGAVPAFRIVNLAGAKITIAAGYAITVGGLLLGATTATDSSDWFVAAWTALVGFGMGMGFATAASTGMKAVPADRSGVASAVIQAVQKTGGAFGAAILGSLLVTGYQSQLSLGGLPVRFADLVRQSLFAGVAVAERLHSPGLLTNVRQAFVHGMDLALVVSAGIAAIAVVLALIFMPGRVPVSAAQPSREGQAARSAA